MRRLLRHLRDRRRWRLLWVALTFDSAFAIGMRQADGGRYRDAIVAIVDDDEARTGMISLAEQLPEAIRQGLFDDLDDWLSDEFTPEPSPAPAVAERLGPRRLDGMRCAATGDAFAAIATWDDGSEVVTALAETASRQRQVLRAVGRLAAAIRTGQLDEVGGRLDCWPGDDGRGAA